MWVSYKAIVLLWMQWLCIRLQHVLICMLLLVIRVEHECIACCHVKLDISIFSFYILKRAS